MKNIGISLFVCICIVLGIVGISLHESSPNGDIYVQTDMKLNDHNIVEYSDWYKDTDEYNYLRLECDLYVHDINATMYYIESEVCHTSNYDSNGRDRGEYFVELPENQYISIQRYISLYYPEVKESELLALDFVKSKPIQYVDTGKTINGYTFQGYTDIPIYTYTDEYYNNNIDCFIETEAILYEDDFYKYVYTKLSPTDSCETYYSPNTSSNYAYKYILSGLIFFSPIDEFVRINIDVITWSDIEATGIGTKVAK